MKINLHTKSDFINPQNGNFADIIGLLLRIIDFFIIYDKLLAIYYGERYEKIDYMGF